MLHKLELSRITSDAIRFNSDLALIDTPTHA